MAPRAFGSARFSSESLAAADDTGMPLRLVSSWELSL